MKIAIVGTSINNLDLSKLVMKKLEEEGIDASTIEEAYIVVGNDTDKLPPADVVFELKALGEEYRTSLEALERYSKTKDITYSTKFKDTGAKYGKHTKSRGKM